MGASTVTEEGLGRSRGRSRAEHSGRAGARTEEPYMAPHATGEPVMAPCQPSVTVARKTTAGSQRGSQKWLDRTQHEGAPREQRGSRGRARGSIKRARESIEGASGERLDKSVASARAKQRDLNPPSVTSWPRFGETIYL